MSKNSIIDAQEELKEQIVLEIDKCSSIGYYMQNYINYKDSNFPPMPEKISVYEELLKMNPKEVAILKGRSRNYIMIKE